MFRRPILIAQEKKVIQRVMFHRTYTFAFGNLHFRTLKYIFGKYTFVLGKYTFVL